MHTIPTTKTRFTPTQIAPETFLIHDHHGEGTDPVSGGLNSLVIRTVAKLMAGGIEPPVWRSGNAAGGDEANSRFIARFRDRVRWL